MEKKTGKEKKKKGKEGEEAEVKYCVILTVISSSYCYETSGAILTFI